MISEELHDRAIEYVFRLLDEQKMAAFQQALEENPELSALVRDLKARVADLALSASPVKPPETLWPRIKQELAREHAAPQPPFSPKSPKNLPAERQAGHSWLPWALAACFALACGLLTLNQVRIQRQLVEVSRHDELSKMKIATLASQVEAYAKVGAVVVWDVARQTGVVELTKLPPLDPEHDYQLWVIDPAQPNPVSAGVVTVEPDGSARVVFHPTLSVQSAQTFALSVEAKGGGSLPQGQIVLAGQ